MKRIFAWMLVFTVLFGMVLSGCTEDAPEPVVNQCDQGHTDVDNNGSCDVCSVSVLVNLDFYAINDLHGKLRDTASQPGVDELSTYLRRAYFAEENVIVFSSGDMWQGSSESNLTRGYMMTEWMNNLDFVSMT